MSVLGYKICKNTYRDSVFLMKISAGISELSGIDLASAMMATDRNKDLFKGSGLWNDEISLSNPDDLVVAINACDKDSLCDALKKADDMLNAAAKPSSAPGEISITRIDTAVKSRDTFNICMISTPGEYGRYEAAKAINLGLNVMLYSDNISIEDELSLKKLAHEKDLILMGPDCGTAIIGGTPLAFANEIRKGTIGIVGASGTGTQEISTLIHRFGGGISHAFGTGGRDVKEEIGGITMMDCLELLKSDTDTSVIAIVSKPPCENVVKKIASFISSCTKPVVVAFAGMDKCDAISAAGGVMARSFKEASLIAVDLAHIQITQLKSPNINININRSRPYLRGIFCGGSLCYESLHRASSTGLSPLYSNLHMDGVLPLDDVNTSVSNTFLDMGEDIFTVGKPHPMIDPTERNRRLLRELEDPRVRVVLLDCVIGYGSCDDPAKGIIEAMEKAGDDIPAVVVSICGTDLDVQNFDEISRRLTLSGAIVLPTNIDAADFALNLME